MDSECIICIRFSKKKKKTRGNPPPMRKEKNLPHFGHDGDRSFEGKNYTHFFGGGGNRHELGKN